MTVKLKSDEEKKMDTQRKVEFAVNFIEQAIAHRMSAKTWGKVSVTAVIEGGYVKEILIDDLTVIRELST